MSNKDFNNNVIKLVRAELSGVRDLPKKSDADLLKSYSPWYDSLKMGLFLCQILELFCS